MYKVLGIDQKEYGPVSAEVLCRWIKEGRANAQTKAQTEGSSEWKPLSQHPEFAAMLNLGKLPPPLPGLPPRSPKARPAPQKTCGQAIASLVLGILALPTCGITSLVGLPLGIVALKKIKRSEGRLGGQGIAIAGICVSGLFLLLLPMQVAIAFPALSQARNRAHMTNCRNNLQQLGQAMRMYANDQSDKFALAANWSDALQSYAGSASAFTCPAGSSRQRCHFGYNARLSGLEESRINPKAVLFFEAEGGWNVSGGPERMIRKPRHFVYTFCYADGSVEQLPAAQLSRLRWDP